MMSRWLRAHTWATHNSESYKTILESNDVILDAAITDRLLPMICCAFELAEIAASPNK